MSNSHCYRACSENPEPQRHMPHAPDASTNVVKRDYSIVVFVNIDWKKSRQETPKAKKSNMVIIEGTVRSIIQIHKPVVICFCEVGETDNPMTLSQMSAVSEVIEATWHELLQSTQLKSSFTQGYPYLTVWDSSRVDCFNFHITRCYEPQTWRTAQLFGMRVGTLEVDMVNVHLSSGNVKLTDAARKGSLGEILQRKSSIHDGSIGQSRFFLLGGDMNTTKELMSQIFSNLKKEHLLQSDDMPNFIAPPHAKHGDLAVTMDPNVIAAPGQARNHDPQHVPVALKLFHPKLPPEQGKAQCLRFCPQTTHPGRQEELEHVRTGHLRPAHYNNSASSCNATTQHTTTTQDGYRPTSPCTATEHAATMTPCPGAPSASSAMISKPDGQAMDIPDLTPLTSHPPAPDDDFDSPCAATEHAEAQQDHEPAISKLMTKKMTNEDPGAATEQAEAQQDHEPASPKPMTKKMTNEDDEAYGQRDHDGLVTDDEFACQEVTDDEFACQEDDNNADVAERLYCSISLLMWSANLDNPEVETIIRDCVAERLISTREVIDSMEEICYPFFFAERDRGGLATEQATKWTPHDLCQIMRNLLWYDWFRQGVLDKHGLAAQATLTDAQTSECAKDHREWFQLNELRPDQSRASTTSYISARMHRDVGNRFAVYSTWKFGLPTIGEPLRQACLQSAMLQSTLSVDDRLAVWEHVDLCINWCQWVARDVRQRKATDRYKEEKRKSGRWKQSGLNDTELAARQYKQQQQELRRPRR